MNDYMKFVEKGRSGEEKMSFLQIKIQEADSCLEEEKDIRLGNESVQEEPRISRMKLEDKVKEEPLISSTDLEDEEELKPPVSVWAKEELEEQEDVEGEEDPLLCCNESALNARVKKEEELSPRGEHSLQDSWEAQSSAGIATGHCGENTRHAARQAPMITKTKFRHSQSHSNHKYECRVCEKRFHRKTSLNTHICSHTGGTHFLCSVCGKLLPSKESQFRHMVSHTKEQSFHCSLCKKSFSLKSNLIKHLRFHSGEKSFQCSVCKKSFSLKHVLVRHLRMHTKEKHFQCSVCKKRFSSKNDLITHIRIHMGERSH